MNLLTKVFFGEGNTVVSQFNKQMDRVMTQEQFYQVVDAILAGKYSWACVLILRFAGYNPLHYIPYRTYNRITKENESSVRRKNNSPRNLKPPEVNISNLDYLGSLQEGLEGIKGGAGNWLFEITMLE